MSRQDRAKQQAFVTVYISHRMRTSKHLMSQIVSPLVDFCATVCVPMCMFVYHVVYFLQTDEMRKKINPSKEKDE